MQLLPRSAGIGTKWQIRDLDHRNRVSRNFENTSNEPSLTANDTSSMLVATAQPNAKVRCNAAWYASLACWRDNASGRSAIALEACLNLLIICAQG